MNKLGTYSSAIMQENCEDLFGQGDYKTRYIKTLKIRSSEYSNYEFSPKERNYSIYRHLALKVQEAMGYSQTNKWIMDQIVDIEAVEVCNKIVSVYKSLTAS